MLNENSNTGISKLKGVYRTQSCDPSHGLEVIWEMSNMMISKLRGVWNIQSYDPPHGLEITWELKMSKLELNCLFTCLFTHLYKLSS
jgi:hypothetical protein